MKSINIARVSTAEQQEAGNSLPAQIERMKNHCRRKGFEVEKVFSFDESAYKEKRDVFDEALLYIQARAKFEKVAVCFDKVDRFSRNVFDKRVALLCELARSGKIELHFASDNQVINGDGTANSKFQFGISLNLAEYYSNAISDNVKRAFEQKRRVGEWTGNPRIGYVRKQRRNEKGEVIETDIILDEVRAPIIRKLFEMYATGGYSITTLWKEADRMGLRGLKGQKLSRSNIELMLKDTFLCGMAVSKKYGEYPHKYPKLITPDLFQECRDVLRGRSTRRSKLLSKPYVLKGLLRCNNCGCMLSPEIKKGKFIYYSCTNAKGICKRDYVPEKKLLEPVHAVFDAFKMIPHEVQERLVAELRELNEHEAVYHERQIARIRGEYDRAQRKVNALLDMRLDMGITQEDYDNKLQELKEEQYRLNAELEAYTKADHQYHTHVGTVLDLSRRMGEIFESSEPDEKRTILGYLLQNPTVNEKTLEFTLRKPFDTVLAFAHHPTELRG